MRRRSILMVMSGAVLMMATACGENSPPLGMASDRVEAAGDQGDQVVTVPATVRTTLDPVETSETTTTAVAAPVIMATTSTASSTTSTTSTTTSASLVESVIPTAAPPPAANADEPIIEVGSIEIPRIGVSKTMYEGVSLGVLDNGPGHWPGTAGPGQIGNMVIAGHRMSHDRPFRDIDLLAPGDEVIISDVTDRYVYHVTSTEIVKPDAMWILDPTPTATATLFACHPKGSTRQRIVVHLELVTA